MINLRHIVLTLLIIGSQFVFCQTANLIKNGSFELFNTPTNWNNYGGGFFDPSVFPVARIVLNWETFNSPDYFTSYYPYVNGVASVPSNWFGNSATKNGNAYAGIAVFQGSGGDYKEYVYQQLATPLKTDSVYCLSYFVTMADRLQIAVKNLGAYFSPSVPTLVAGSYVNNIPQIINATGFITDTVNWVEIQGCFTALGGEQYITIGSFRDRASTDTLNTISTNPLTGAGNNFSYYYIDSVSLWQNNFPTGIKEIDKENSFSVYPNPSTGKIKLSSKHIKDIESIIIKITDIWGREVLMHDYKEELDITAFEKGIYFLSLYKNQQLIETKKIIKE